MGSDRRQVFVLPHRMFWAALVVFLLIAQTLVARTPGPVVEAGRPNLIILAQTWFTIQEACLATLKATALVMQIFFGAILFVGFYILRGRAIDRPS
jgi:TRAP-type mannitol/chloroaromatic compound transport system permease large subunit